MLQIWPCVQVTKYKTLRQAADRTDARGFTAYTSQTKEYKEH
jgi:hypothetical protein